MDWHRAGIESRRSETSGQSIDDWLEERRRGSDASVEEIPLSELRRWALERTDGHLALRHDTGRFFSVEGRRVRTNFGPKAEWDQAVINQPERGLLGIVSRVRNGVLEFLMQAKMEPGCINGIQASPTIQATKSNYTQVHQGRIPAYFEYFADYGARGSWITRSPQVEQTTRFLYKKNINAVLLSEEDDIPLSPDFRWCTLREIKQLYMQDNGVNMNARSILACLPPIPSDSLLVGSEVLPKNPEVGDRLAALYASIGNAHESGDYHTSAWLHEMSETFSMESRPVSLDELDGWTIGETSISSDFFSVVGVRVKADREVAEWDQPLVSQPEKGLSFMVGKTIDGQPHFLMQAKCDAGGDPAVHLAPTVSCSVPSLRKGTTAAPPFLDYALDKNPQDCFLHTTLSEEGGRFQKCENTYAVAWDEDFPETDLPGHFRWIPYETVFELIRHGRVNIEARSLFGFLV